MTEIAFINANSGQEESAVAAELDRLALVSHGLVPLLTRVWSSLGHGALGERLLLSDSFSSCHWRWPSSAGDAVIQLSSSDSRSPSSASSSAWALESGAWCFRESVSVVVSNLGIYIFPPLLRLDSQSAPFLLATEYRFVSFHDICWLSLPHVRLTEALPAGNDTVGGGVSSAAAQIRGHHPASPKAASIGADVAVEAPNSAPDLIGVRTTELYIRLRSGADLWLQAVDESSPLTAVSETSAPSSSSPSTPSSATSEKSSNAASAETRRQLLAEVIAQACEASTGMPLELHSAEETSDRSQLLDALRRSQAKRRAAAVAASNQTALAKTQSDSDDSSGSDSDDQDGNTGRAVEIGPEWLSALDGAAYTIASSERFGPSESAPRHWPAGVDVVPIASGSALPPVPALLDLDEMRSEQQRRWWVDVPPLHTAWVSYRMWTPDQARLEDNSLEARRAVQRQVSDSLGREEQTAPIPRANSAGLSSEAPPALAASFASTALPAVPDSTDTVASPHAALSAPPPHDVSDILADVDNIAPVKEESFSFARMYRGSSLERWMESVFDKDEPPAATPEPAAKSATATPPADSSAGLSSPTLAAGQSEGVTPRAAVSQRVFAVLDRDFLRLFSNQREYEAVQFVLSTPPAQRARLPMAATAARAIALHRATAVAALNASASDAPWSYLGVEAPHAVGAQSFSLRSADNDLYLFHLEQEVSHPIPADATAAAPTPAEPELDAVRWVSSIEQRFEQTRALLQKRRAQDAAARAAAWAKRRSSTANS